MNARWARLLLLAYALLLVVVLFSPSNHVQGSLVGKVTDELETLHPGRLFISSHVEVALNAVIIAPLSLLGTFAYRRLSWQDWTAYAFAGASLVELVQKVFLPGRQASFSDIVANTGGAMIGGLLGALVVRLSSRAAP